VGTRAGTIELAVPKLRQGSYYSEWLLERRHRAERALATVVTTSYLLGVSTRRVEKLAESLGVTKLSKSQVSVMAAELDEMVTSFRSRPQDAGPYTFLCGKPPYSTSTPPPWSNASTQPLPRKRYSSGTTSGHYYSDHILRQNEPLKPVDASNSLHKPLHNYVTLWAPVDHHRRSSTVVPGG
jgi:hypothetical protein